MDTHAEPLRRIGGRFRRLKNNIKGGSSIKQHDNAEPHKPGRLSLGTSSHGRRFVAMGPNFLLQRLR